jgi:transcriptional regulator with PAS, ATPase and Fis domain
MSPPASPLLQSLIDTHDNPFVLIDREYRIVAANHAYCQAYGVTDGQVVGRRCYEVSHHRDAPCHLNGEDCPHQQVFEQGKTHQVLHTHYDHEGHPDTVRIVGHAVRDERGELMLGETVFRLAPRDTLDCATMRLNGRAPAFLRALESLERAARSEAPVLLCGESGVGKELAAQHLHAHSRRPTGPFLTVDCATLAGSLFESELFGHERGAFTGCIGRKQGLFELAHGGTLFLDEVGEIPLESQAKLLRVLESGEFRRVGGREVLRADVRVVCATNRELRTMIEDGTFREDLYYRLACITIDLPSLRERRSDIPALAEALLERANQSGGKRCCLSGEALERLMGYDFPGNVRELRNILQRAVALCRGGMIRAEDLGLEPRTPPDEALPWQGMEARYIRELLERFDGHRGRVAETLQISERTLYRKLKRYGLGRRLAQDPA